MGETTRILVVEDEYAIAVGLRDDLEAEGYQVDVAADGLEGERTARTGSYDLILLDAPTFSNSKRMEGTLDLQRDHADLIEATAALLSPEGILLFSTNFRRFKLDPALLEVFRVDDISKKTLPPDFERNPRIHSCFRIMRRGAAPPAPPVARQTGWRKEPHAL